jgi:hypothetical protein
MLMVLGLLGLIAVMNLIIWRIFRLEILNPLTTLCIWAALSMWYTIPGLIAALYQEETPFFPVYLENSSATGEVWFEDFCKAFFIESFAVCLILGGIWLFQSQRKRRLRQSQLMATSRQHERYQIPNIYKVAVLFLFLVTLLYQALRAEQDTYLQVNSSELYGSSNWLVFLIKQLTMSITLLVALYEPKRSYFMYGAFGLITLDTFLTSLGGNRIILLIPIILVVFRSLLNNNISPPVDAGLVYAGEFYSSPQHRLQPKKGHRFKVVILFGTIACFLWFIFIPIAQSVERVRLQGGTVNWSAVAENAFSKENDNKLALSTIFWKLDSFTGGAILTREDGYGTAGFTPYIGSLLVIVPRAIIPSRPVAGTSDGTIDTYPSRLVPKTIGVKSDVLNVGVSPLHITLWQFGYFGVIVFVISNILYFRFLDSLLASRSFWLQTLGVYSVSLPTFATIFLSPDTALKNVVFVIFFLVLLKLGRLLRNTMRRESRPGETKGAHQTSRYSNFR